MEILVPVWSDSGKRLPPKRRPKDLKGALVGILDDNLDPPFTERLEQIFRERVPEAQVRHWHKPYGTAPSPKDLIEEVAGQADVAVVGVAL
jgi:hypothetical protein